MVDIIVPVYLGLADTQRCISSVLASKASVPFRLVVINDASPDSEITQYLHELKAQDSRLLLLENEQNLGFVQTVNRGMELGTEHDVVLLNSDAEVANDWLDRLQRAAYSAPSVGSVTPFSNNATICSYPHFCQDNPLPQGFDTAKLDLLFKEANAYRTINIPTAIGFCMYIRRDALNDVGLFDAHHFGKGYGEENDFCMRAHKRGWKHLLALDVFVRHVGGVSFEASSNPRKQAALEKMQALHPNYEVLVGRHILQDAARPARLAVDFCRIHQSQKPALLFVTHARGGGTERHVQELAESLASKANIFVLRPYPGGQVQLEWIAKDEIFQLYFLFPQQQDKLLKALRDLGVAHIHYHHFVDHSAAIRQLADQLGVSYDFTAHDFYAICPRISLTQSDNRYCALEGVEQCKRCLKSFLPQTSIDIEAWRSQSRAFLSQARYCMAPSEDAAKRLNQVLPEVKIHVVPHRDLEDRAVPQPTSKLIAHHAVLRVCVIGALSPIKGADILEAVALEAQRQNALVEFHLIGYAYRALATSSKAKLIVYGQYAEADLIDLLDKVQPDIVWFPAQWPETYSYTLSACIQAGLPVVVPDLGAFQERLANRDWTWVSAWDRAPAEWLDFFTQIRVKHFVTGLSPARLAIDDVKSEQNFYRANYLPKTKALFQRKMTFEVAQEYSTVPICPRGRAWLQYLKHTLFNLLLQLRRASYLRKLIKHIPMHWQSRVKNWLVR